MKSDTFSAVTWVQVNKCYAVKLNLRPTFPMSVIRGPVGTWSSNVAPCLLHARIAIGQWSLPVSHIFIWSENSRPRSEAKDCRNFRLVPVPFYCFCLRGQIRRSGQKFRREYVPEGTLIGDCDHFLHGLNIWFFVKVKSLKPEVFEMGISKIKSDTYRQTTDFYIVYHVFYILLDNNIPKVLKYCL
jgi:hypothetical protein